MRRSLTASLRGRLLIRLAVPALSAWTGFAPACGGEQDSSPDANAGTSATSASGTAGSGTSSGGSAGGKIAGGAAGVASSAGTASGGTNATPRGGSSAGNLGGSAGAAGPAMSGAPSGGANNLGGSSGSEAGSSSGGSGNAGGATGGSGGGAPEPMSWPLINGIQWADTEGKPIQAHGGGVLEVDGAYYWFGENRNSDGTFYAVSAYRSRDLVRWEFVHHVLREDSAAGLDPANVERPKVVFNAATGKYVMWMHWENGSDYGEARAAVASSDTVAGDYTYHGSFRPLRDSGVMDHGKPGYMSRDCTLFVDDDGKGYFISATNENYDLNLYELTPDYLELNRLVATLFEGGHREAPALFKRDGVYFLLTSGATGWDPNQAQYATSRAIGSGWSSMQNVANGTTFHSQSTYVLPVQGSSGTSYLYLGDRWAGAWGGRVNDSSYVWQPIEFPSPTSMHMSWNNTLSFDVAAGSISGATRNFRFLNVKSGKALDVAGAGTAEGDKIIQNPASDSESQFWSLNYDSAGHFRLTNVNSGKIIDVPDESNDDGVELVQWENHNGDNQVWLLADLGQGIVKIRNKKSGKFAAVVAGANDDGAAVEQRTGGDGDEQKWKIVTE
jgi:hypothetical protein